jgi:hypothetical protein
LNEGAIVRLGVSGVEATGVQLARKSPHAQTKAVDPHEVVRRFGLADPTPDGIEVEVREKAVEVGDVRVLVLQQTAQVAHTVSGSMDRPWTLLGALDPPNLENKQPLLIDGTWHLLGTTIPLVHRPRLYTLEGDPNDPRAWLKWKLKRELNIPEEAWNTGANPAEYERSNAAYLIDERAIDGYFYLLYAGSTEVQTHSGRGHSRLGLARSQNLTSWRTP